MKKNQIILVNDKEQGSLGVYMEVNQSIANQKVNFRINKDLLNKTNYQNNLYYDKSRLSQQNLKYFKFIEQPVSKSIKSKYLMFCQQSCPKIDQTCQSSVKPKMRKLGNLQNYKSNYKRQSMVRIQNVFF